MNAYSIGAGMSYESEIVYDNTKTLDPRIKDRLKYDDKGLVWRRHPAIRYP